MAKKIQPQYVHDFIGGGERLNPHYKPRASRRATNPTTVLTDKVIEYINRHDRCYAGRANIQGHYRPNLGQYVSVGLAVGWPDITASFYGRIVGIEIKRGKDFQSEAQKAVAARIKATGGAYLIVSDFDTFKALFDQYMAAKQKQLSK